MEKYRPLILKILISVGVITIVNIVVLGFTLYREIKSRMVEMQSTTLTESIPYIPEAIEAQKKILLEEISYVMEDTDTTSRDLATNETALAYLQDLCELNHLSNAALFDLQGKTLVSVVSENFSSQGEIGRAHV